MKEWGGSFVKALAEAALHADPINLRKIKAAWPEYWSKYERLEARREQVEQVRARVLSATPGEGE